MTTANTSACQVIDNDAISLTELYKKAGVTSPTPFADDIYLAEAKLDVADIGWQLTTIVEEQ
mgnify:CR=1 FL=1